MDVSQAQASRYSGSVYSFVSDFCDLMYTGSGAWVGCSLNHLNVIHDW